MYHVYFNQNGMWMYVGSVKKKYEIGDVVKLKQVYYPLRVIEVRDSDVCRHQHNIYCELVK